MERAATHWRDRTDDACRYANVGDRTAKARIHGWSLPNHDCADGVAYTSIVGRYQANPFGLHDMFGNVWEWVADCWNETYGGAPDDGSAWTTGYCERRGIRGGGWNSEPRLVRSAGRGGVALQDRSDVVGFRIARTLP